MNIHKLVSHLRTLKETIKRMTPPDGRITPEILASVKKSDFAFDLRKYNLLNQLDTLNISTFDGTINLTLNQKKISVSAFTDFLNKGDLIGALKSIGISQNALSHAPIQHRALRFKAQFNSSKLNRLHISLVANKALGAKFQKAFNLPEFKTTTSKVNIIRKLLDDRIFTKRVLAPLYHKLKASPGRIPWLKGLVVGSFSTFVGVLVGAVIEFMQDNNGCWLYPKQNSSVTQECKVNLLTCNENYKSELNLCTDKCKGSDNNQEYLCFQEAALKKHCKNFTNKSDTALCGTKKDCSWACNNKRICVPKDKELRCINYTFWEAFVTVTKDYLPVLNFINPILIILILVGSFLLLLWVIQRMVK